MARFEEHKFFCLNCGKEGIPLPRRVSHKHKTFHYKKLWCPYCKMEINHIEVSSPEEETIFKQNFIEGVYKADAEQSLSIIRGAGLR